LVGSVKQARTVSKIRTLRVLETLPVTLNTGVAVFGIIAMVFLVWGKFYSAIIIPIGLVAAVIAGITTHKLAVRQSENRPGSRREIFAFDVIIVCGVLLWIFLNIPFASQHVFTDRDPATYNVTGQWLSSHHDLHIPRNAVLGYMPYIDLGTGAGFGVNPHNPNEVYAQGSHLLPAYLGIVAKFAGSFAMFRLNLFFGGIALLAMYGFARLFMKPWYALLAAATISISLPFFNFSRDTYTEPLSLALVFTSLTLLWYAVQTKRTSAWFLAGLTLGCGLLARVDVFLPVAALEVFLIISLANATKKERSKTLLSVAVFTLAVAALGYLAWIDLAKLSSGYYRDIHGQIMKEIQLVIGLLVVGIIVVCLAWMTNIIKFCINQAKKLNHNFVTWAIIVFFGFLAIRPAFNIHLTSDQNVLAHPTILNGYSLYWVLWYIPVLGLLGIVGFAWAWGRYIKGQFHKLLPFLLVLSADCLIYFIQPSISPDQPWATRRFLPVVFPGLAILGFLLIEKMFEGKDFKLPWRGVDQRLLATSLATLAVVTPIIVSYPFAVAHTYAHQLTQVEAVCSSLPGDAAIYWYGGVTNSLPEPTQAFCHKPAFGIDILPNQTLPVVFNEIYKAGLTQGKTIFFGVDQYGLQTLPPQYSSAFTPINSLVYSQILQTYKKFPRTRAMYSQTIYLARVGPHGQLEQLPSQ
jgi:4-amino-4-deoxy-L-arabinose transferase-like glycosyltransferase